MQPSVGSKCAFIIALILEVGAARGWTRWRSGDSRLWVIERTEVFAHVAAPPLTRDGQLPAQVARVLELPLPGQDGWLKHDVLFAAHVCTRLRASASASASASARLGPFPSRESFPVGLRSRPSLDLATRTPVTS